MMQLICDRCGDTIDTGTNEKKHSAYRISEQKMNGGWMPLDICPKCLEDLCKWIKEGGTQHDD